MKIVEKVERLIGNIIINIVEFWMYIRCKFDGGKIYNLCNRGLWYVWCYGGVLCMNYGL